MQKIKKNVIIDVLGERRMMEYKDNDFGNLIKSIRNKNKINAETLVRGICSVKVLNNIESGKTILRLPNTRKNEREVMNLSYVITSSNAFYATLDKVVAGLNTASFTSKDYRIDDYVEQDTEFPVEQAGNIQTELKLDNDVTDDTNNVSDEIDSLNVDFVREQISPFVNNENMESQSQSKATNMILEYLQTNDQITSAKIQEMCGFTKQQARSVIDKMRNEKLIDICRRGNKSYYVII